MSTKNMLLPWYAKPDGHLCDIWGTSDNAAQTPVLMAHNLMPDKAIFIVRACNCHEDLLKVARVAISWYEHPAVQAAFLKDEVLCGRLNEAIVLARAAIRKAENGVNHVVDY